MRSERATKWDQVEPEMPTGADPSEAGTVLAALSRRYARVSAEQLAEFGGLTGVVASDTLAMLSAANVLGDDITAPHLAPLIEMFGGVEYVCALAAWHHACVALARRQKQTPAVTPAPLPPPPPLPAGAA